MSHYRSLMDLIKIDNTKNRLWISGMTASSDLKAESKKGSRFEKISTIQND